jgi:MFS family permease
VIYAVASVAGPIVGGLFVDHLSWRWAFLVNLPVGALSATIVLVALHLPHRRVRHSLDIAGAIYLTSGLACLVLVASLGGHDIAWTSASMALLVGVMAVLVVLFVRRERRASEPVLPFRLFANPVVRVSAGINLTSGMLLWCGIFFVPLFVQEVRGLSPTRSGLLLTPLMFGAAFGTLVSGKRVARSGSYRIWPITGSLLAGAAIALLTQLDASTPVAGIAVAVLMLGTGVGFVMQPSLLAAQNAVEHRDLGTTTSTALLFRVGGGTIGVPILGGILNAGLAGRVRDADAFADVLPTVFLAAVPVAIGCIVLSYLLEERPLREQVSSAPDAAGELPVPSSTG